MKLTFITGKGGVGKSAMTAGIGAVLSSLQYKVGLLELDETRISDFFGSPPSNYKGRRIRPNITAMRLDPKSCFEEYMERQLPKAALMAVKNRYVHHFINAVPGLNEILILGKITSLLEEEDWDTLLIDAPATGHTLSLIDAPRIALGALNKGPLRTTVSKILNLLDSDNTGFLLVSQLESFIVEETIELHQHLHQRLQLSPHGLLINGFQKSPLDIPKDFPRGLTPFFAKLEMQKEMNRKLQQTILGDIGFVGWQDRPEIDLVDAIAWELKPWILKNYLQRKG